VDAPIGIVIADPPLGDGVWDGAGVGDESPPPQPIANAMNADKKTRRDIELSFQKSNER
jgi:hypothetical protein